ncbi:MAG: RlmE family RNA methyltransferase [Spirochaetota bacterium]
MARRDRPDHYSRRAKREGFSARSVYKLQELQRRFGILGRGMKVLDVGAAPGSWSQLARKVVADGGTIVAVDLCELPALEHAPNVETIVGDVYDPDVIARLEAGGPYDALISDAAPKTSGNRTLDTARSAAIVEHLIALAPRLLSSGGNFVAKVFQGGDEQDLLAQARERFETARLVKPKASRDESFETFLVGIGFRGV